MALPPYADQQPLTPEEVEAERNLYAAGEVLRAERSTVDVESEYRRFMEAHSPNVETEAGPRQPRWLTGVRYSLIAAAAVAILVIVLRPKTEGEVPKQLTAKSEVGLVYQADNQTGSVAIVSSKGTAVTLPADQGQEVDARDLATGSETMTITIPKGNTYRVNLSDGTKVYLNADSRLTFPTSFVGRNRTVELDGEAYFDVAHDAGHPFVVRTKGMETKVLGTEFYVRANAYEPQEVTLISGRIEVSTPRQSLVMSPGQQTHIAADGTQTVLHADVDHYTYWRDGFIYNDNVDMLQVMREIGRNYNCDIEFRDSTLLHYKVHFVAERSSSIDRIVQMLNQMDRVKVTRQGNRLIVQ
jgi:transmembrane sensor